MRMALAAAGLLASAALAGMSAAQQSDVVGAEQIAGPPQTSRDTVNVIQLPPGLEPLARGDEEALGKADAPPPSLTADVIAAWNLIRARGQTPTPDLIAREIGPDKLAEFLATTPAAASILATGTEPDPQLPKESGTEGGVQPMASPGAG